MQQQIWFQALGIPSVTSPTTTAHIVRVTETCEKHSNTNMYSQGSIGLWRIVHSIGRGDMLGPDITLITLKRISVNMGCSGAEQCCITCRIVACRQAGWQTGKGPSPTVWRVLYAGSASADCRTYTTHSHLPWPG